MPRNKRHGNVTSLDTDTLTQETSTVSTDTDAGPQFHFEIEPAEAGYEPDRARPGRERTPSFFDGPLVDKLNQGWQRTPHDGDLQGVDKGKAIEPGEMIQTILRELEKAKKHNGLGLDIYVTDTHVEWNSRPLRPRKANSKSADGDETSETEEYDTDDESDV